MTTMRDLYPLTRERDGSVTVRDPQLYAVGTVLPPGATQPDDPERIATGAVKTTDVLLLKVQSPQPPGPRWPFGRDANARRGGRILVAGGAIARRCQ